MAVGPVTGRKIKRSTIRNATIIGVVVVVLLVIAYGGLFTAKNVSEKAEAETQNILQQASIQAADAVADPVASIQKQLDALAQDPQHFCAQAQWMNVLKSLSEGAQTTFGAYHRPWL